MVRTSWGVDSAQNATPSLYECVVSNYGKPDFWGRYVSTVEGASEGLTPSEVTFLANKGVKILPIYNDFKRAVGFRNGQVAARNAIFYARRLGFPKGTIIFSNIDDFFEVDAGWIQGWVDAFYTSGFRPGFYNDPEEGQFSEAFCQAVNASEKVKNQSILWSNKPRPGVTTKRKAPNYNPVKPPCYSVVYAWQYGRDASECPIDTNLIDSKLLQYLV